MSIAMKLNQVFSSIAGKMKSKPAAKATPAPKAAEPKPAATTSSSSSLTSTTTKHKSGKFFEDVEAKLKAEGASLVSKVNAVIGFDIGCANNQTISYVIDLKTAPGSVKVNDGSIKPGCTISIGDDDLLSVISGKLNMMTAFTQKKLKISGNMSIAMKLNQLFSSVAKPQAKL